jgi:Rieske Fe-S protein
MRTSPRISEPVAPPSAPTSVASATCRGTVVAGAAAELPVGAARLLVRDDGGLDDYKLYVCRDAQGPFALDAHCTHRGCIVKPAGGGFLCPCHQSKYDYSGRPLDGPAPAPLARYAACVDAAGVVRISLSPSE